MDDTRAREASNKRRETRFIVEGLQGKMTFASEVSILNMSLSGVAIRTDRRLNIGQEYQLRLEADGEGVNMRGAVVWCSLESRRKDTRGDDILIYSAGLRFTHVMSEALQNLMTFLGQHKRHADQRTGGTRFEIDATGRALLDVPQPFRVKVLSLNGMLAQSPSELALEAVMPMELSLDEGEPVRFDGRVAYCTEVDLDEGAVYEIGVEFVDIPEEDRSRVATYIERLKAR
ncbi:MAG TPA: PilZ domain-containing protein [Vicinamibacteria bacterium]|nr:PilZ domain-containing protein [Vicinamibacteria bacterium]